MKNKINLKKIIRESIKSVLLENDRYDANKLYTYCATSKKDDIKDILTYGLRSNDNGEAHGVWFNIGKPFYSDSQMIGGLLLSLPRTEETMKLFKFDKYDWENSSSQIVAHSDVPIEYLTVEKCIWMAIVNPNGSISLEMGDKVYFESLDDINTWTREYLYIIYEDMYQLLFGVKIDENKKKKIIENCPNVKFEKFLS